MNFIRRAIVGVAAAFLAVTSTQAAWKDLKDEHGNITGTHTIARKGQEMVGLFYRCGFVNGPVCRLDLQLALPCDGVNAPVSVPIQYGKKLTKALLECRGVGGTATRGGSVQQIYNVSRIPGEDVYKSKTFSWTVTLPGQGSGPVPVFTEKKLIFIFPGPERDVKYTFSTRGAAKKMEEVYQNWATQGKLRR